MLRSFMLDFLYMFVKSARVQFPICWTRGVGCEGQWPKNLAGSRWLITRMGSMFRVSCRWTVGVRLEWLPTNRRHPHVANSFWVFRPRFYTLFLRLILIVHAPSNLYFLKLKLTIWTWCYRQRAPTQLRCSPPPFFFESMTSHTARP
jgi:hypothetical protein